MFSIHALFEGVVVFNGQQHKRDMAMLCLSEPFMRVSRTFFSSKACWLFGSIVQVPAATICNRKTHSRGPPTPQTPRLTRAHAADLLHSQLLQSQLNKSTRRRRRLHCCSPFTC